MTRPPLVAAILIALVLCAAPAQAEEDAAELLRLGRVAVDVEHDTAKGLALLQRVVILDPAGSSGAEALWVIAHVQESRRKTSDALEALRALTQRFTSTMSEARKREVHDALLRLLPPGSQEPSPLGTIYVAASGSEPAPEISPLARKIREMLDRYDGVVPSDQSRARDTLEKRLRAVGKDALPILREIARQASPSRAWIAAEMMAKVGSDAALPGLVDLVTNGDAFTRQAALGAFNWFAPKSDVSSPAVVEAIDGLLALDLPADQRADLRRRLSYHLSAEARLEFHLRGGEDAVWWLERALSRKAEGALERSLELIRAGGEDGRQALVALVPKLVPHGNTPALYPIEVLGADDASRALDLLLSESLDARDETTGALVALVGLIERTADEAARAGAREKAWRAFAALEDEAVRQELVEQLGGWAFPPPASLLSDTGFARVLLETLNGARANIGSNRLLGTLVQLGAPFWEAFFDTLPHMENARTRNLMRRIENLLPKVAIGRSLPPAAYDRRWIDLLESLDRVQDGLMPPDYALAAAARSGDPRFLDLVRRNTFGRQWDTRHQRWLYWLKDYSGPGALAFLEECLEDERCPGQFWGPLLTAVANDPSPEARDLLVRVACDWALPVGKTALDRLGSAVAGEALLEIVGRVRPALDKVPLDYRRLLMSLLKRLHLRRAVPYLLDEFRLGPLSANAATAMDEIRAHYERLETFERFAKGADEEVPERSSEPTGRRLEDLLEDESPAIRRAAAIALGALARSNALERLVVLAQDDPAEAVRKAALEAIERIAAER